MTATEMKTCDIFCRVIDNYGDIGVCWRLARQLAREYPVTVRLWLDEVGALAHLWPSASLADQQIVEMVDIRLWLTSFDHSVKPADVVIEAFACNLPDSYLAAMKNKSIPPYWFNLEYLSAEDWVEECHGLLSPHPKLGLKKMFFFPGFTQKTGGLLKEKSLIAERNVFLSDRSQPAMFLQSINVQVNQDAVIISLFSYENTAIASLIDTWAASLKPVICLVPSSKILSSINFHIDQNLQVGDEFEKGSLRIKVIPFLIQTDYDKLLWSCDINFVRGEDSFVRAQWAGKPFIWHIYPQDDDVHLIKLDAFLKRYLEHVTPELKAANSLLSHQWNLSDACNQSWLRCLENLENWQTHSLDWSDRLDSQPDLASVLISYTL